MPPNPEPPPSRGSFRELFSSITGNLSKTVASARAGAQNIPPAPDRNVPLSAQAPAQSAEQRAQESAERSRFIAAYQQNPTALPEFQDPRHVYKVIADERTYQTELATALQEQHKILLLGWSGSQQDPAFLAKKAALETQIQAARDKLTELFLLLKSVTGIKRKTGGTGFLPPGS